MHTWAINLNENSEIQFRDLLYSIYALYLNIWNLGNYILWLSNQHIKCILKYQQFMIIKFHICWIEFGLYFLEQICLSCSNVSLVCSRDISRYIFEKKKKLLILMCWRIFGWDIFEHSSCAVARQKVKKQIEIKTLSISDLDIPCLR